VSVKTSLTQSIQCLQSLEASLDPFQNGNFGLKGLDSVDVGHLSQKWVEKQVFYVDSHVLG
jgi:hypothetical protein